jgi:hypothetical protein
VTVAAGDSGGQQYDDHVDYQVDRVSTIAVEL